MSGFHNKFSAVQGEHIVQGTLYSCDIPSDPVNSYALSSQHAVPDYHLLVRAIQMHPEHFLGSNICKVQPVFPVVKIKRYHIVKALGNTAVVLAICRQFSDVILVGEY